MRDLAGGPPNKNLTEVIDRVLIRHHAALRAAAQAVARTAAGGAEQAPSSAGHGRRPTKVQQERQARRERRLARYQEVMALNEQGCSQREIAAAVGIGRHAVRLFLRAEAFPERLGRVPRVTGLRRYEAYLRERWTAGCDNAHQLWCELRAQGYPGSASHVRQFVARWRLQPSRPGKKGPRHAAAHAAPPPPATHTYSPRQTTWHLLRDPNTLTAHERAYLLQLEQTCPPIARLQVLARAFYDVVHRQDLAGFARWLDEADGAGLPELTGFAGGLRADRPAVEAGLTLPWSQGQTEGQVNRLNGVSSA